MPEAEDEVFQLLHRSTPERDRLRRSRQWYSPGRPIVSTSDPQAAFGHARRAENGKCPDPRKGPAHGTGDARPLRALWDDAPAHRSPGPYLLVRVHVLSALRRGHGRGLPQLRRRAGGQTSPGDRIGVRQRRCPSTAGASPPRRGPRVRGRVSKGPTSPGRGVFGGQVDGVETPGPQRRAARRAVREQLSTMCGYAARALELWRGFREEPPDPAELTGRPAAFATVTACQALLPGPLTPFRAPILRSASICAPVKATAALAQLDEGEVDVAVAGFPVRLPEPLVSRTMATTGLVFVTARHRPDLGLDGPFVLPHGGLVRDTADRWFRSRGTAPDLAGRTAGPRSAVDPRRAALRHRRGPPAGARPQRCGATDSRPSPPTRLRSRSRSGCACGGWICGAPRWRRLWSLTAEFAFRSFRSSQGRGVRRPEATVAHRLAQRRSLPRTGSVTPAARRGEAPRQRAAGPPRDSVDGDMHVADLYIAFLCIPCMRRCARPPVSSARERRNPWPERTVGAFLRARGPE
jgi:hypothetical protein